MKKSKRSGAEKLFQDEQMRRDLSRRRAAVRAKYAAVFPQSNKIAAFSQT
jgi:hypothetical protein